MVSPAQSGPLKFTNDKHLRSPLFTFQPSNRQRQAPARDTPSLFLGSSSHHRSKVPHHQTRHDHRTQHLRHHLQPIDRKLRLADCAASLKRLLLTNRQRQYVSRHRSVECSQAERGARIHLSHPEPSSAETLAQLSKPLTITDPWWHKYKYRNSCARLDDEAIQFQRQRKLLRQPWALHVGL